MLYIKVQFLSITYSQICLRMIQYWFLLWRSTKGSVPISDALSGKAWIYWPHKPLKSFFPFHFMIIFSFVLCSALVPLMKPKWGVIGFWRAAKRTAEAAGVGCSSRPPPPPEKWRPLGKSREGGLIWETMRLREAGRGFASRGECVRHTGGAECVCACVGVCIWKCTICLMGKVWLWSSPTILPSA